MAVTLNDWFKQSKDPTAKGFIADLLRASDLMRVVPFKAVPGLQVSGQRWQTLPDVAFRKIGGGYTEGTGNVEEIQETMAIMGGDVKIDRVLKLASNVIENPLETQMKMKAQSIAFKFVDTFVNGDQGVDADSFEGIKKRVSNAPGRMTIDLASSGDALKVLNSSTTEHQFVDALHKAMKYVDGATHILGNETSYLGLGQVARRLNLYQVITDALEKKWETFDGVPMVDVGLKKDKSTEIITDTEDPGDGGNDGSSLYVVRMDTDDGLHAINLEGTTPDPYDPLSGGEMEAGPQMLRRIDWVLGLFNLSQYSICRIKGFKMAAS